MFTQNMYKKRFAFILLLSAGISSLLLLFSLVYAFAGIAIISMIIGGILYIMNIKTKRSVGNISRIVVFLVSITLFSSGCTVKVPMVPNHQVETCVHCYEIRFLEASNSSDISKISVR